MIEGLVGLGLACPGRRRPPADAVFSKSQWAPAEDAFRKYQCSRLTLVAQPERVSSAPQRD